jgi:hypothetical protein
VTARPLGVRAAHAARDALAEELVAAALPGLDRFLADTMTFAIAAIDGPVLLAATYRSTPEPFSLAGVRQRFARRLGASAWVPPALAEKVHAAVGEVLARVGRPGHTRDQVVDEVVAATEPDTWQPELENAASTQATRSLNERQMATMAALGPGASKRWAARRDSRTRPDHEEANGQVVPLAAPFRVGGELLQYPGDPTGSPGQTYNCRCVVVPG